MPRAVSAAQNHLALQLDFAGRVCWQSQLAGRRLSLVTGVSSGSRSDNRWRQQRGIRHRSGLELRARLGCRSHALVKAKNHLRLMALWVRCLVN